MRVMVDLPARDVWRIQEKAERAGVTSGQVLRDELTVARTAKEAREQIRQRVLAGMCDADIATELHYVPGTVAGIRRSLGLRANPRYPKRERRTA